MHFHEIDHRKIDLCSQPIFLLSILIIAAEKTNGIVPVSIILASYCFGLLLGRMDRWLVNRFSHWMAFPVF